MSFCTQHYPASLNLYVFHAQTTLGLAIAPPLTAIFTFVLLNSGRMLVVYIWLFAVAVQLIALTIYPLIASLFNKFESLPDGPLRCPAPHYEHSQGLSIHRDCSLFQCPTTELCRSVRQSFPC